MPSTLWELLAKLALGSASRAASPSPVKPVTATTSATRERKRGRRPLIWASFCYESAGLWNDSDIRLRRLPAVWVRLLRFVVGDRAGDDHVVALLPVHRCRDLVLGGQLQRVDHP